MSPRLQGIQKIQVLGIDARSDLNPKQQKIVVNKPSEI